MTQAESKPVARQCTAVSNSTGKRCKHSAIHGGTVCRVHGGSAPQVKAKAERRLAEADAQARARILFIRKNLGEADTPFAMLESLIQETWAVKNLLLGKMADSPDQLPVLLPAWGAVMKELMDALPAMLKLDPASLPHRMGAASSIEDLLKSLPSGPRPQLPPARPQAAQEPRDEIDRSDDASEPVDGQAVVLEAQHRLRTLADGTVWEQA